MSKPGTRDLWTTLPWIGLAPMLLALACATPPPPASLTDAQAAYQNAESTPAIQQSASVELYEAKQALDRANAEWDRTHDVKETDHLAYLANRRVEVAQLWAAGRAALKEAQTLDQQAAKETTRMMTEAERARADAEASKQAALEATDREKQLRGELSELQARETARGLEMTLGDVLFDVGKSSLKPGAMQNLYRLATFLKEYPDRAVLVEGHTDSTGSDALNMTLSQSRAESVQTFLISNGVAPTRVATRGYGKAYPVATNDTSAGRQQNRRVDIVILHPGESPEGKLRPAVP